jgi:hypothetical protein
MNKIKQKSSFAVQKRVRDGGGYILEPVCSFTGKNNLLRLNQAAEGARKLDICHIKAQLLSALHTNERRTDLNFPK